MEKKYFTDQEKCNLIEETWKNVFKITEKDENNFNKQHSDHIDRYITVNINRINSFPTANKERLNNENDFSREITLEEVKMYIRRARNKALGSTKINKLILENCTDKTLQQLRNIYNVCLFPEWLQVIKFIIKFISIK